jgi:hypothetical protein
MEKEQAEKALQIIRQVIENTRDDLIDRNWGLIWMVHSFINFAGAACGTLIQRYDLPLYWYAAPLAAMTVLNILVVLVLVERDQGVHSYVERQLWAIWISFFVFTLAALAVMQILQARPELFSPLFALTSGFAFAMMGVVFYRRFLAAGALFLAVMLAAALLPGVQWWLIGAAWWLATFVPGFVAHRERLLRRRAGGPKAKIL